jgi:hypothetical protein
MAIFNTPELPHTDGIRLVTGGSPKFLHYEQISSY